MTSESFEVVIVPPSKDLGGGFTVRRALPSVHRRMVGPFIFFDQMGPVILRPGDGLDVRPHPHIGLATVTYLFEGEILHRDSLGSVQPIRPGELNWMTAGHGIVHSERTPPELRPVEKGIFGIQAWVALPRDQEERAPSFVHHGSNELPLLEGEGKRVRVVAGEMYGARSPVQTASDLFYVDAELEPGAHLSVPPVAEERAIFSARGTIEIVEDGARYEAGQLLVLKPGRDVTVVAPEGARVLVLGGAPMDGPRHIYWNFVSSSLERIEQGKADWREGRFPKVPGDEKEFIPLPATPQSIVRYP